jgi:cysteine desulfurase
MCSVAGPPLREKRPRPIADDQPYPIYLDHNATTPVSEAAWEAMMECRTLEIWGNPSSTHAYGLHAKFYVDKARADVARAVNAESAEQIIFTSGGTESNNLAILGTVMPRLREQGKNVILTTPFEHDAVANVLTDLSTYYGCTIVHCPVSDETGVVDLRQFGDVARQHHDRLALVTVMHANNEIGAIQPVREIAAILAGLAVEYGVPRVPFHVDAAQSIGKIPVDVMAMDVDFLSVCSHKFYGPKGVGALYRRRQASPLVSPTFGAGQEAKQRPGTENLILIRGMAAALTNAADNLDANSAHFRERRDRLHAELQRLAAKHNFEVRVNGSLEHCLPNTLNMALYHVPNAMYVSATRLIAGLGMSVAMSAGAACHAVGHEEVLAKVSTSLQAVRVDNDRAKGTLRLSTGHLCSLEDMPRAATIIMRAAIAQMPEV